MVSEATKPSDFTSAHTTRDRKISSVHLSPKEIRCLELCAEGKTDVEIAGSCGVTRHAIRVRLNSIKRKLGSVDRTNAVAIGIRTGLIA